MYLLALIIPYCIAYFVIAVLFAFFFTGKRVVSFHRPARSLAIIILVALEVLAIMYVIPDLELQNRIEHALGGGVIATLICFLAVRDTRVPVNKFQFFIFTLLLVTSLGVVNELFEFFLQTHTSIVASANPLDTWRDLTSNTIGILATLACTTPFISKRNGQKVA